MLLTHPTVFIINSDAIGDVTCSLPAIKWICDNYKRYKILAPYQLKDLFFFVPEDRFHDLKDTIFLDDKYLEIYLNSFHARNFNPEFIEYDNLNKRSTQVPLPLRMHLCQYASIQLLNRVWSLEQMNYLKYPLDNDEIKEFDIDFSKCVATNITYRDSARTMPKEEMNKICDYIESKGYQVLLLGTTRSSWPHNEEYKSLDLKNRGIDLRDKTSIKQSINIISKCKAVFGMDGGIMHLAGMTNTPIVCGYTMVAPEYRMPIRDNILGKDVYPVLPDDDLECKFCTSAWQLETHDYRSCYFKHLNCVKQMTAEKFIDKLGILI
jgi:ADP-heptose:LPS heptosyltransferase